MEDGKIVAEFPNYRHTAEISGGKLVEVSSQITRLFIKKTTKNLKSSRLKILSLDLKRGSYMLGTDTRFYSCY